MTPEQARIMSELSEQILIRDLAVLAEVTQQDRNLEQLQKTERASVAAEMKAATGETDPLMQAALDRFVKASGAREAAVQAARAALVSKLGLAQAAAQRAFGRAKAVEALAARSADQRRERTVRSEERMMTSIALAKAAAERRMNQQRNRSDK